MAVRYFCPSCEAEISEDDLIDEINKSLRVHDIDVRDTISVLVESPYLICGECHKKIDLTEDGLLVQHKAVTPKVKMRVEVTG